MKDSFLVKDVDEADEIFFRLFGKYDKMYYDTILTLSGESILLLYNSNYDCFIVTFANESIAHKVIKSIKKQAEYLYNL